MVTPVPAPAVLNREFLEIRCKILEVAAALDRLDRGSGSVAKDPRLEKLLEAITTLADAKENRAERVQIIFSRPYNQDWQREFGVSPRS